MKTLLGIAGMAAGFVASLGMFAAGLAFAAWFIATEPGPRPGPSVDVADLWTAEPRRVDKKAQRLERVAALRPTSAAPRELVVSTAAASAVDPVTTGSVQPPQSGEAASAQLAALHAKWCAQRYRSWRPHDNRYTSYRGEQRPCVSPFMNGDGARHAAGAPENGAGSPADEVGAFQGEVLPPETLQEQPSQGGIFPQGRAEIVEELPAPAFEIEKLFAPELEIEEFPARSENDEGPAAEQVQELPAPAEEPLPQYALGEDAGGWIDADHVSYCFSRYRSYRPEDNTYQPYGGGPRRQCE